MQGVDDTRRGALYGASSYALWGLFPLYWPLLRPASDGAVLAHRMVWSLVVMAVVLSVSGSWRAFGRLLADRGRVARLALAATLLSVNWGTYIYGVDTGHVVETSLGYFINPIFTVLLGVLVLRERLRPAQWVAVGVAVVAVCVLTVQAGRPPWIALVLAVSFGGYGLLKKTVRVPAVEGFAVETAVLAPVAAAYLALSGGGTLAGHGAGHALLLASTGLVTTVPLLMFAGAARRLPLYALGVLQYIAPTMQFLIGVAVRHEPLPLLRMLGFALVWAGLAVFTTDLVRARRRAAPVAAV